MNSAKEPPVKSTPVKQVASSEPFWSGSELAKGVAQRVEKGKFYGDLAVGAARNAAENPPVVFQNEYPNLIPALFKDPFRPEPGFEYGGGRTWTYVEFASRLRLLFITLYHFAQAAAAERKELETAKSNLSTKASEETRKALSKIEIRIAAKPTYLHHFFDYLNKYQDVWTASRIPKGEQDILIENQTRIDDSIMEHVKQTDRFPFMVPSDVQNHIIRDLLFSSYPHVLESIADGPIGPVSPEVAFILALQLAGIDLAAMATFRQKQAEDNVWDTKTAPAPNMYRAASFPEGKKDLNKGLYNSTVVAYQEVHTTTRTKETDVLGTAGVGVSIGIDLFCGIGINYDRDQDQRRYLSFSFHPVDTDTHGTVTILDDRSFSPCVYGAGNGDTPISAPSTTARGQRQPSPDDKSLIKAGTNAPPILKPNSSFAKPGPEQQLFDSPSTLNTNPKTQTNSKQEPIEESKDNSDNAKKASLNRGPSPPQKDVSKLEKEEATAKGNEKKGNEKKGKEVKGNEQKRFVWPHCHQGFWSAIAFNQMFLKSPADGWVFKQKDTEFPQYRQPRPSHIYLRAETEVLTGKPSSRTSNM